MPPRGIDGASIIVKVQAICTIFGVFSFGYQQFLLFGGGAPGACRPRASAAAAAHVAARAAPPASAVTRTPPASRRRARRLSHLPYCSLTTFLSCCGAAPSLRAPPASGARLRARSGSSLSASVEAVEANPSLEFTTFPRSVLLTFAFLAISLVRLARLFVLPTVGGLYFMYRYISHESCSQFDSLPLTSLTVPLRSPVPYDRATERSRRRRRHRAPRYHRPAGAQAQKYPDVRDEAGALVQRDGGCRTGGGDDCYRWRLERGVRDVTTRERSARFRILTDLAIQRSFAPYLT